MLLRTRLETELNKVHTSILHMGTLVEEALYRSLSALAAGDVELADQVITADLQIDAMQSQIEEHVTRTIAMEQPVAEDLRILITCIKLAGDIERIGDHARHIARAVNRVSREGVEVVLAKLQAMSEIGIGMLHDVLTAFMEGDPVMAAGIARRDDRIDSMHTTVYAELIAYMQETPDHIEDGTRLLLLSRFLERLGDHAANMCEWVAYAKEGSAHEHSTDSDS